VFSGGGTFAANVTGNDVKALVRGASSLTGLGHTGLTDPRDASKTLRGVVVQARANTTQSGNNITGGFSLAAAINVLISANVIGDRAVVELGTRNRTDQSVRINRAASSALLGELGLSANDADAHAQQDTILDASVKNDVFAFGGAANFGYYAGLGGTVAGTVIGSKARVLTNLSDLGARRTIALNSNIQTRLFNVAISAGTGIAGIGGALGVHVVGSDALTEVRGGVFTAREGNVDIDANVETKALTMGGTAGAGIVGAGMAVQATVFGSKAVARVTGSGLADIRPAIVTANAGDVSVRATTDAYTLSGVAGSGGGGVAIPVSANAAVMQAETRVDIGAGVTLDAGRDVRLEAFENVRQRGIAGSVNAGVLSVGGSFNYTRFAGTTQVNIGSDSIILAGRDVLATARVDRVVMAGAVVGSVSTGGGAISFGLNVLDMGGMAGPEDTRQALPSAPGGAVPANAGDRADPILHARALYLADVQAQIDQGPGQADAQDLAARGGAGAAVTRNDAERAKVDLTGTPGTDKVGVVIGADARLTAARNLAITADATVRAQLYGGTLALAPTGFVGGAGGYGVGVTRTGAQVSVGDGAIRGQMVT